MFGSPLTPHEALALARKRRGLSQPAAAELLECGLHDLIAIEKGRLVPSATENGLQLATNIEREFEIPLSAWTATKEAA